MADMQENERIPTVIYEVDLVEHRMIMEALAWATHPAYVRLRKELSDVQFPKNLDTGRDKMGDAE